MDRHLDFFNYEGCLTYYKGRIENINQAKKHGEESVAKPVLLLAVIDSITYGEISSNCIKLTEQLMARYNGLMRTYARGLHYYAQTPVATPFWHLQGDGFWHLAGAEGVRTMTSTPSVSWLQAHMGHAYVDEALWVLLQNRAMRMQLRDYIVEHKLTDDHWLGKMAAEGLGVIAALLVAA